jgi:molecular chaperone HscA
VIEATTKALSDATQAFAAMRMNRGIRRALSGKNITSV